MSLKLWDNPCRNCNHYGSHKTFSNSRGRYECLECNCSNREPRVIEDQRYTLLFLRQLILSLLALAIALLIGMAIFSLPLVWATLFVGFQFTIYSFLLMLFFNFPLDKSDEPPHEGSLRFNIAMLLLSPAWAVFWLIYTAQHFQRGYAQVKEQRTFEKEHPTPGALLQAKSNLKKIELEINRVGITPELDTAKKIAQKTLQEVEELPRRISKDSARVQAAKIVKESEELLEVTKQRYEIHHQQLEEGHGQELAYLANASAPQLAKPRVEKIICAVCSEEFYSDTVHNCPKENRALA